MMSENMRIVLFIAFCLVVVALFVPAVLTLSFLYNKLECYYFPSHMACERLR